GVIDLPGGAAEDLFRDRVAEPVSLCPRLVLLRDPPGEDDEGRRYVDLARRQATDRGLRGSELLAGGERAPQRVAPRAARADFGTVYCGLASGVDPGGVRPGEW